MLGGPRGARQKQSQDLTSAGCSGGHPAWQLFARAGMSLALKLPSPHKCHAAPGAEHLPAHQHHPGPAALLPPQSGGWKVVPGLCPSEPVGLCWFARHMPAALRSRSLHPAGPHGVTHASREPVQVRGCRALATEPLRWTLAAWTDGATAAKSRGGICCPDGYVCVEGTVGHRGPRVAKERASRMSRTF